MKKSYRILQLQFLLQFYKGTHPPYTIHIQPTHAQVHYIQRILHPESNSTCRRQRALRVLLLHSRGQRDLHFQKRNSTHRRHGDLLEMHPCVLQDLPLTFTGIPATRPSKGTPVTPVAPETFQTFQSFMTVQPFRAILQILQVPVFPGNPTHYSILQLECIFYIFYMFYKFYSSIGFHRKLHRVPVEQLQTFYKHSFFKEREMLLYRSNVHR